MLLLSSAVEALSLESSVPSSELLPLLESLNLESSVPFLELRPSLESLPLSLFPNLRFTKERSPMERAVEVVAAAVSGV